MGKIFKNKYIYYFIIVSLILVLVLNTMNSIKETFVPRLKKIYNPIKRNIRIKYEGLYNKVKKHTTNSLRKIGLL